MKERGVGEGVTTVEAAGIEFGVEGGMNESAFEDVEFGLEEGFKAGIEVDKEVEVGLDAVLNAADFDVNFGRSSSSSLETSWEMSWTLDLVGGATDRRGIKSASSGMTNSSDTPEVSADVTVDAGTAVDAWGSSDWVKESSAFVNRSANAMPASVKENLAGQLSFLTSSLANSVFIEDQAE